MDERDEMRPVNDWLMEAASTVHGRGLFASRAVPAGTRLIEYVGERITKSQSADRCAADNPYIFCLDEDWDLDGAVAWNPARWINHSCEPNCEAEQDEGHIWIVARRGIAAGEEVTFNYGYDLEGYREHPCRCGASSCVGYIVAEEFFDLVRRSLGMGSARG